MILKRLIYLLFAFSLLACSTTKSLKKNQTYYQGSRIHMNKNQASEKWKMENASVKYATLYLDLWDAPNGALFGLPFVSFIPMRLYVYHWFYDSNATGINPWVRANFGEAPKTISLINPELKVLKGINIFENYGHFGTTGYHTLSYNKKKNKAFIHYYFDIKPPYHYQKVSFTAENKVAEFQQQLKTYGQESKLKRGQEFNLYAIREEKLALWQYLQNHGYYYIKKQDFLVAADTTVGFKEVDLEIMVAKKLTPATYQPQVLNDIKFEIDTITQQKNLTKYYSWRTGRLKKHILDSMLVISANENFALDKTQHTVRNLDELGIFTNPRVNYTIDENDSLRLNPTVIMGVRDATKIGFNIKGNYKTAGYIGPSIGFTFKQLNVFGGAENLSVTGDFYYDFPVGIYSNRLSQSSGYSLRSTLSSPLIKTPFNLLENNYALPKRVIGLNFDYNNRVNYFDLIGWNFTYGWEWKTNEKWSHKLDLINATYSDVRNTTDRFDELTASNPLLRESLIDQFILGSAYQINFTREATKANPWGIYYKGTVDMAGNFLNLASSVLTDQSTGDQEIVGVPFAQYVRLHSEFVANWHFTQRSQLVFRNISGIGFAYGNSYQMPYIKQYFIGGTNSLRPFPARAIGPGRFLQFDEAEVNQVGDVKIECNIEYRFPLFWKLHFAVFADMGNIWLLEADENRPGGEIRWNKIIEDSYLTSGVGLRLETNYITLRLDLATIIYWPSFGDGERWIWQNNLPAWAPVIGIGYPF